jgi:hypothetical protein
MSFFSSYQLLRRDYHPRETKARQGYPKEKDKKEMRCTYGYQW